MRKKMFLFFMTSTLLTSALLSSSAIACTSILVDKNATTDGGYIAARNDDSDVFSMPDFVVHQHKTNKAGGVLKSYDNSFTYPLPTTSMRYTSISDYHAIAPKSFLKSETGFNELGVGISATETIFGSPQALKVDPYSKTGITEVAITDVILPRIHSAREGVLLLGKIIETQGSGEGFGVAFIDKNELWYLENGSAHQWMATRIPTGQYFVSGNQGRLRDYNPKDTVNYLGSKTLVSFAQQHGLYKAGQKFDFHKAYIKDDVNDTTYNYPRVWVLQNLYNPSLKSKVADSKTAPVFMKAAKKLSIADIKAGLRNRYEGTMHDPYANQNPKETYRPIAVFRVEQSHIMQVRPNLPSDIGAVNYVAIGMQLLSVYIPYYKGMSHYLPEYDTATSDVDSKSVGWQYRKLQSLAMQNYKKYAPIVEKAYTDLEASIARDQVVMEKQYMSLYKTSPTKARSIIQTYEEKWMKEGLSVTASLTKQLETDLKITNPTNDYYKKITTDFYTKYGFHGA